MIFSLDIPFFFKTPVKTLRFNHLYSFPYDRMLVEGVPPLRNQKCRAWARVLGPGSTCRARNSSGSLGTQEEQRKSELWFGDFLGVPVTKTPY